MVVSVRVRGWVIQCDYDITLKGWLRVKSWF